MSKKVADNAMRVVVGTVVLAAAVCLFVLGGFAALRQAVMTFAVIGAVVGLTFMLFMHNLTKFPGWPLFLFGEGLVVACAFIFSNEIVQGLGTLGLKMNLLPLAIVDGQFTVSPMIVLFGFLVVLGFGILLYRRRN
jgi:hypothetical protein